MKDKGQNKKGEEGKGDNSPKDVIPLIPNKIVYKIRPYLLRNNFLNWRKYYNDTGKIIKDSDLADVKLPKLAKKQEDSEDYSSDEKEGATQSKKRKKNNKKDKGSKTKIRSQRTKVNVSGTKEGTGATRVTVNSDESSESEESGDSTADESGKEEKTHQCSACKSRRWLCRGMNTGASRAVLDSGSDFDVIGGTGWTILHQDEEKSEALGGALEGMGDVRLLLVSAVTSLRVDEGVVFLRVGKAVYGYWKSQTESLINCHELWRNGVEVDDISR